jgi:tRNA(adenine34) deaminase
VPSDVDFMSAALQAAAISLGEDQLPVGAIAVRYDKIIARAHRCEEMNDRLGHAEMVALEMAVDAVGAAAMREVTIYSTLEPCVMCMGAMLHCYVKRIVFAFEDRFGGATNLVHAKLPVRHRSHIPEVTGGVLREESRLLFGKYLATTKNPFWSNQKENPFALAVQTLTSP